MPNRKKLGGNRDVCPKTKAPSSLLKGLNNAEIDHKPNDLNVYVRDSRSGNPEPRRKFCCCSFPMTFFLSEFSIRTFNLEVN